MRLCVCVCVCVAAALVLPADCKDVGMCVADWKAKGLVCGVKGGVAYAELTLVCVCACVWGEVSK